jgi:hypothetical protein
VFITDTVVEEAVAKILKKPSGEFASPVMATPLPPEARVFQYAATASPRSAGASPRVAKGFLRLARASPEVAGRLLRSARVLPRLVGTLFAPTFFR